MMQRFHVVLGQKLILQVLKILKIIDKFSLESIDDKNEKYINITIDDTDIAWDYDKERFKNIDVDK